MAPTKTHEAEPGQGCFPGRCSHRHCCSPGKNVVTSQRRDDDLGWGPHIFLCIHTLRRVASSPGQRLTLTYPPAILICRGREITVADDNPKYCPAERSGYGTA